MIAKQSSSLTRRRFLASTGFACTAAWLAPRGILAENTADGIVNTMRKSAATAKIKVEPLRKNINALIGAGGNIAVLHGKEGKLLVDAGITGARPQITKALADISSDPIKYVVNTHWHFDHTDGNEWLHSTGAIIVAHENTRKRLSASTRVEDWNFTFPPSPAGALPTIVLKKDVTIHLNDTPVVLTYYGPAHTDTDVSIEFTEADVLHVGDTWWNGHYPFIDYGTGGSINAMIRATKANLARSTDKTIFIPGHGPVGNKSQLTEYRDMLVTVRDKVAALKKEDKHLDEIIAAKPTADFDAKWGGFLIKPENFTKLVYAGV